MPFVVSHLMCHVIPLRIKNYELQGFWIVEKIHEFSSTVMCLI